MSIAEALPQSTIRVMMALAQQYPDALNLAVGEPDFDTPAHIVEAGARALRDGATRYTPTPGIPALRAAVAERASEKTGRAVGADGVQVTTGAVGALAASIFSLVAAGDHVLIPNPGWPNYVSLVMMAQATPVPYALRPRDGFEPDLDELEQLMRDPRVTTALVNTPGNPTGAVWPADVVERIVRIADANGVRIISDEVYEDLTFDRPHTPAARFSDTVVTVSGVSKSYAMTGWRLGWAVADPAVVSLMSRVQEPRVSCASAVAQVAALAALEGPQDSLEQMRATYARRRGILSEVLEPAGLLPVEPQGAFYGLVDLRSTGLRGMDAAQRLLVEHGVVTVAGDGFGSEADGFVRVAFAAADDVVRNGAMAIRAFAQENREE